MESRNKANICKITIKKLEGSKLRFHHNKGITLIALAVTIVVLLILAGITLNYTIGDNGVIKEAQNAKNKAIEKATNAEQESQSLISEIAGEKRIDGVTKLIADGSWNVDKQVNTPKLLSGMTAIYWDESGKEITVTAENYDNWYDYVAQTGTTDGTSKWANAKTEDGSYWVWIPRFAYKIESGRYTSTAGKISIKFLQGTSNKDASGNVISTTYPSTTGETMESYVVHPSFRNGSSSHFMNGEWDSEIAGFWVAKFEMSMETSSDNGATWSVSESNTEKNVLTVANSIRTVSKPGVSSWVNLSIGNAYTNAYNYNRTYESHLMKNSEWGAVAYLTQSNYGRNGNEVWINNSSSFITGSCGNSASAAVDVGTTTDYKSSQGVNASSTGNVSGVYDLSGGVWERVAGYITNGNVNLSNYGKANDGNTFVATYTANTEGYKTLSTKYSTVYSYDSSNNTSTESYNSNWTLYNRLKSITYGYGDAILETSTSGHTVLSTIWNSDQHDFAGASYPFFLRGGAYDSTQNAGIFAFGATGGDNFYVYGFRTILVGSYAPTCTGIEIKNVSPTGYDVYVYGVSGWNDTGWSNTAISKVQFPTWTDSNGQDDLLSNWNTNSYASGTRQSDGTTWVYRVNISDHNNETGLYHTHVYALDYNGVWNCVATKNVTVP